MKRILFILLIALAGLALANGDYYFGREVDGNQDATLKCDIYLNTGDSVLSGQAAILSYGSVKWKCGYGSGCTGKLKVVVYNVTGTDTGAWYCVDSSDLITRSNDVTMQWDSAAFSGYTTSPDSTYAVGFAVNAFMIAAWCYDDVIAGRRKPVSNASIIKDVACTGSEPLIVTPLNDSISVLGYQWCVKASYTDAIKPQVIMVN